MNKYFYYIHQQVIRTRIFIIVTKNFICVKINKKNNKKAFC